MREKISATDHAALAILKKTGLDVVEAAQLAHERARQPMEEGKGMHPAGRGSPGCQRKNGSVQESRG